MTREQITRDLEAMKQGGMRGGEIWDVAAMADPDGRVPAGPAFLGPEFTRLIVHAIREADRLGLEIGIVASSGWNAGGSWVPPEHAGKGLYQSTTTVNGPKEFHAELPLPELPKLCPRDANGRPLYLRDVAVLAVPHDTSKTLTDVNQVVDVTKRIEADGKLRWEVPAGEWDILRFVCANHGQQWIVPSPNSGGPMIDFFDPRATQFHLHHIVTAILRELGRPSFEGTSFKTLEFDSMELDGFTPWNDIMADEFQRRVGYPVLRWLPLLAGWQLADHQVQEQFSHDWRRLVSDLLIDSHSVTGRKFLEAYAVKLIAKAGLWPTFAPLPVDGPWQVEFPERWGAPRLTNFAKLQSWSGSDNEGTRFFPARIRWRSGLPTSGPTGSMGIRCDPSQPALRGATSIGFKPIRPRIVHTGEFPAARHGPCTPRYHR
jgi:hypothetical protein